MPTTCPSCGFKNIEGVDECENCGADLRTVDLPKALTKLEKTVMELPLTALEMTKVHSVSPQTTVEDAVHTLNRQKLDILEVVEGDKLVGLLSVRDIVTRVGTNYREKMALPIRQFMTPNPETLAPEVPITFAINKMDVGGYRHVPVVQGDRMIGVVSSRDVIHHIVKHSRDKVAVAGRTTSHGLEKPPVTPGA
jgi:CBS domain-containing protein